MSTPFFPAEEKVRNRWKKYYYTALALVLIAAFIDCFSSLQDNAVEAVHGFHMLVVFSGQFLFAALKAVFPLWILYYFAYTCYGTKLLMCNLIFSPLQIIRETIELVESSKEEPAILPVVVFFLIFSILFYRANWNLRKVNKAHKKRLKDQDSELSEEALVSSS